MKIADFLPLTIVLVIGSVAQEAIVQKASAQNSTQIVASLVLTNQAGPIPLTTLVTPQKATLYRVSTYWETTKIGTAGIMCGFVFWTDYSLTPGVDGLDCIAMAPNTRQVGYPYAAGQSFVIQATAGNPVTFRTIVDRNNPLAGSPEYAIYITVESLTP